MPEKSTNFEDYLRHSRGPKTGERHTQYPVGSSGRPGPQSPISGVEINNPAKSKRVERPPENGAFPESLRDFFAEMAKESTR